MCARVPILVTYLSLHLSRYLKDQDAAQELEKEFMDEKDREKPQDGSATPPASLVHTPYTVYGLDTYTVHIRIFTRVRYGDTHTFDVHIFARKCNVLFEQVDWQELPSGIGALKTVELIEGLCAKVGVFFLSLARARGMCGCVCVCV